jgi:threonine/homoserine/homoserine lactone efflux protein
VLAAVITFAGVFALSAALPGSDTLLLFARAVDGGARAALPYAIGILVAKLILLTLAVVGVTAFVLAFGAAFIALKIAGAGYLVYLGVRRWRNAGTSRAARDVPQRAGFARAVAIGTGFGLGNTQAILFYVALVPQVLRGQPATFVEFGLLCLTLVFVFSAVACVYVLLATRVRARLADRRGSRGVDRTAAVLMAATGVLVVAR